MLFVSQCLKLLSRGSPKGLVRCFSTRTSTSSLPTTSVLPCIQLSNPWIWQKPDPIKLPIGSIKRINLPNELLKVNPMIEPINNIVDTVVEDPLLINNNNNKEAARLIVIRRKKMKKHKLKKLRKRMKYEWAKLRQRRELKKEKEFQATLIAQCKEAEAFSAEEYVANIIKQAIEKPPIPFKDTPEYKELMRRKNLRLYQYEKKNV